MGTLFYFWDTTCLNILNLSCNFWIRYVSAGEEAMSHGQEGHHGYLQALGLCGRWYGEKRWRPFRLRRSLTGPLALHCLSQSWLAGTVEGLQPKVWIQTEAQLLEDFGILLKHVSCKHEFHAMNYAGSHMCDRRGQSKEDWGINLSQDIGLVFTQLGDHDRVGGMDAHLKVHTQLHWCSLML